MPAPVTITCSTGRPVSLRSRSTRSRRSQPLRSPGNVETMISSTRSSFTTCQRGGVRIGMHDLAVRVDPLAAQLGERAAQALVGLVVLLLVALRRDDQEARRALARRARGSGRAAPPRRRSGSRSRARSSRRRRSARRRRAGPGHAGDPLDVADDVAAHPARALRAVRRDDDLVDRRLELRERVLHGLDRARSRRRSPAPRAPASRSAFSVFSSRRPAEARRVSS